MSKLLQQIRTEAASFGIEVESDGFEINLSTPEGKRFETDLHGLVARPYEEEGETFEDACRAALADVREYGPSIEDCPHNCSCKS